MKCLSFPLRRILLTCSLLIPIKAIAGPLPQNGLSTSATNASPSALANIVSNSSGAASALISGLGYTPANVGGANTFIGNQTFSNALTANGAFTTNAGSTFNGTTTIGSNTASQFLVMNGQTSSNRSILWKTAGSNRIQLFGTNTAESGNNAGTNLELLFYADDGATSLGNWTIYRANGGGLNINLATATYSGSDAGTNGTTRTLNFADNFTGTTTAGAYYHLFTTTDTMTNGSATVWRFVDQWGGSGANTGSRRFFEPALTQAGPTNAVGANGGGYATVLQPQNLMQYDAGAQTVVEDINTNANLNAGATNVSGISDLEQDIATYSGSTFGSQNFHSINLNGSTGGQGWGVSTFENYAVAATNATDNPTTNNAPTVRDMILIGRGVSQWPFRPTDGRLFHVFPQTVLNTTTAGAGNYFPMKPQQIWRGFDLENVDATDCIFCSPGFHLGGTGTTQIGRLQIADGTNGPVISSPGYVASAPTVIASGATGYIAGEWVYTGQYTFYAPVAAITNQGSGYTSAPTVTVSDGSTAYATVSGGLVTAVVITNPTQDYTSAVPTISFSGGGGTGASAQVTYLQANNDTGSYSGLGGILSIDTVNGSGLPLTVHWITAPYSTSPPANPIPMQLGGSGQNLTVNVNWTLASNISVSSPIVDDSIIASALPTCNSTQKAAHVTVTDLSATPTYYTIVTTSSGGGSNTRIVTCDGTNWRT